MSRNNAIYNFLKKVYCFIFRNKKLLQLRYIIVGKLSGIDIKLEYTENPLSIHPDNAQYQPAYIYYLKRLMKCFSINAVDRLFDYGSGKGAAMIFFAQYLFCEIGGIELMCELHEIAIKNILKKKLNHLTSYNGDAAEYNDIDRYNYFSFIIHFTGESWKQLLNK